MKYTRSEHLYDLTEGYLPDLLAHVYTCINERCSAIRNRYAIFHRYDTKLGIADPGYRAMCIQRISEHKWVFHVYDLYTTEEI